MRIAGGCVALICAMAGCALEAEPVGAADDELMLAASSERVEYDAPVLPEEPTGPVGVCDTHEDCQLFGLAWCLPPTYVGGGHFPDSGGYRVPKGCYGLFHGIGQMCDPSITERPPCPGLQMCWPDPEGIDPRGNQYGFCIPIEL